LLQTKHFFNSTHAWPLRGAWVAQAWPLVAQSQTQSAEGRKFFASGLDLANC